MTVLIAGAGIGGLTLGLSLQAVGIPFRIFEAVEDLRPLGVGINVQPHAVREFFQLGLEDRLEQIGLRTAEVAYFSAQGGRIWDEPRGRAAGYDWPQYSIHRGEAQMLLRAVLLERAGEDYITTGTAVTEWRETVDGVSITLQNRKSGADLGQVEGSVFVAADGINSTARAHLFPNEGPAHWGGIMMWRGITRAPAFLTGRSMAMIGRKQEKFVCYPIHDFGDGTVLVNWIADRAKPADYQWRQQDWNREGAVEDFIAPFEHMGFDWLDVPALIRGAEGIWEYPMVDRNPLEHWTHGRMTLLGDAAHAMYPIGSNGASQAILDARTLTRAFVDTGVSAEALHAYEDLRRETVNRIVLANRGDGPDKVLDVVADKAPDGFGHIHEVMSQSELEEVAAGYKALAGMDIEALNARADIVERSTEIAL